MPDLYKDNEGKMLAMRTRALTCATTDCHKLKSLRVISCLFCLVFLVGSVMGFAAERDLDSRERRRKLQRRSAQKKVEEKARKDLSRDSLRLDLKLDAKEERISTTRIRDQKYSAGVIKREREKQKETDKLLEDAELARIRRAVAARAREKAQSKRSYEQLRKKKKQRIYSLLD